MHSTTTGIGRPILIGDLLVRSEMTSAGEMAEAIPVSLKTGLPVGRVLVASGALSEIHLQHALLAQSLIRDSMLSLELAIEALRVVVREKFSLEQALKIVGWQAETFSNENKLGQLLLAASVINQPQLEEALRVFFTAGLPLARVLVRKGHITNLVAYAALSSQQLLRDNKLSRDQAIQAVKAAAASHAVIEDDYVAGYLRICPPNNLRLGELLILAQLVSEDVLIQSVETALLKGETLGEILVGNGLVRADTMQRALDAQRMVTKGLLDVAKAGDTLRRANYERISISDAMQKEAPAVLLSVNVPPPQEAKPAPPKIDQTRFTATLQEISIPARHKKRSHQETRARELLSKMVEKLEAIHTRNVYMFNILDKDARKLACQIDLQEIKRQIELVDDFDGSMDVIEKLLLQVETFAYQSGFLRARLDAMETEAELKEKVRQADEKVLLISGSHRVITPPAVPTAPSYPVVTSQAPAGKSPDPAQAPPQAQAGKKKDKSKNKRKR